MDKPSETLQGIAASAGVVVAPAVVVGTGRVGYSRRRIAADEIDTELDRFDEAVAVVQQDLQRMAERLNGFADNADDASILDVYIAMIGDNMLAGLVRAAVRDELRCADWAVDWAVRQLTTQLADAEDAYLSERSRDVELAGRQLLRALGGRLDPRHPQGVSTPSIIVANDLSPADAARMIHQPVLGFITERGTRTSHTAIMARALNMPAVVGVQHALQRIRSGDPVVVDGLAGRVIVHPREEQREEATLRAARYQAFAERLGESRDRPARTRDGEAVRLHANVELPSEALTACDHGAEGIGLFRTEFLYLDQLVPPSEEQQVEIYRQVVESVAPRQVTLRTFDIGGDKLAPGLAVPDESNPLLGLRAVRLALCRPEVFMDQLRAMARASAVGDVRIMVPFVANLDELRAVRAMLSQAQRQVRERGQRCADSVPLGVMIELPAAAIMADVFAREADFMSIGTNDLVQYALAVDRTNRALATLASPFHPAILRLISTVARAGAQAQCPVSACGEMASNPYGALLLLGLGLRELSMEAVAIPAVKEAIRRVGRVELERVAEQALAQPTAELVKRLLEERLESRVHDLLIGQFDPGGTA